MREEIGFAIGQTEDVVNFRHAGKVFAIETQDGGPGACPEVGTQPPQLLVGIPQVTQINSQILATRRRRHVIEIPNILVGDPFQMQRPVVLHGNDEKKRRFFGCFQLQQ